MTSQAQGLVLKNNYKERFDPDVYLDVHFHTPETPLGKIRDDTLSSLHRALQKISAQLAQQDRVSVLDYGCGPVVCNIISAAGLPNVCEVVLAEYTERNREAIRKWLNKEPSSFDWSSYFRYVVKTLEGRTDQEVTEREERVRNLVKLVQCDITADPPIQSGYEGPYDVVISFLALEASCTSIEEYRERVLRFSSLVKPGGTLLLLTTNRPDVGKLDTYKVGSETFLDICLSVGVVIDALKSAQFEVTSAGSPEKGNYWSFGVSADFVLINAERKRC